MCRRLRTGRFLGDHSGINQFTVGQRRGLGIGGSDEPLYVIELDPANNLVILGPHSALERPGFFVEELNWLADDLHFEGNSEIDAVVQVRHRHRGVPVKLVRNSTGVEVRFVDEWAVASPGQAAVFYDSANERVLGGGRILPHRLTKDIKQLDLQENSQYLS